MNINAYNFNISANTDDNSCINSVEGCTNPLAGNYNPLANTNDYSCQDILFGCTDSLAPNFNPLANTNDGSCLGVILGCTNILAYNFNSLASADDGSCISYESLNFDCKNPDYLEYNPNADIHSMAFCLTFKIEGCMNPNSFNYSSLATIDNGSCEDIIYGCIDPSSLNYNPLANSYDFSCIEQLTGCTDSLAINFNKFANYDDGSCISPIEGCMDYSAINFNISANIDNNSCIYEQIGCTDEQYLEFDSTAIYSDGSCETLIVEGCMNSLFLEYDIYANTDNNSCFTIKITGCTSSIADNYNPLANFDSGECDFTQVIDSLNNQDSLITIYYNSIISLNDTLDSLDNIVSDMVGITPYVPASQLNTGANMTVIFQASTFTNLPNLIDESYIVAIGSNSGLVVGNQYLSSSFFQSAVTIWGDDNLSIETDGAEAGEEINFQLVNGNEVYDLDVSPPVNYTTNSFFPISTVSVNPSNYFQGLTSVVNVQEPIIIPLIYGWNLIGYSNSNPQNVIETLEPIANSIYIIKNNAGDFYWPEMGDFNGIGDLVPGQGYQIKMKETILNYQFPIIE